MCARIISIYFQKPHTVRVLKHYVSRMRMGAIDCQRNRLSWSPCHDGIFDTVTILRRSRQEEESQGQDFCIEIDTAWGIIKGAFAIRMRSFRR